MYCTQCALLHVCIVKKKKLCNSFATTCLSRYRAPYPALTSSYSAYYYIVYIIITIRVRLCRHHHWFAFDEELSSIVPAIVIPGREVQQPGVYSKHIRVCVRVCVYTYIIISSSSFVCMQIANIRWCVSVPDSHRPSACRGATGSCFSEFLLFIYLLKNHAL